MEKKKECLNTEWEGKIEFLTKIVKIIFLPIMTKMNFKKLCRRSKII